jgi:hypothetical protein
MDAAALARHAVRCGRCNATYEDSASATLTLFGDRSGVLPPERGESRRRTFIYPTEAEALLACRDVPLPWRELYALACYLSYAPASCAP